MKKISLLTRFLLAVILLFVICLTAPSRLTSAAPAEIPDLKSHGSGFVNLTIWQEGLGYDGVNWVQFYTYPIDYYMPTNEGVGFDWGDAYTYLAGNWFRSDGLGWVDCGWIVEWEMFGYITPPPDCTLSIAFQEHYLPGMCWGCVGPFCDAEQTAAEKMPGEVYVSFKIGQEILKAIPVRGQNFEGFTYILIEHVADYGLACEHHAFIP